MATLLLEEKDAELAYEKGNSSDRLLLERLYPQKFKRNIIERVSSYEAACSELNIDPVSNLSYVNPKTALHEYRNNRERLETIAEALQEKEKNDYANALPKYTPYFIWDQSLNGGSGGFRFFISYGSYGYACAGSGSAFCFKTKAKSDHFGSSYFIDLWNKVLSFQNGLV